jgi:hypothetical protein
MVRPISEVGGVAEGRAISPGGLLTRGLPLIKGAAVSDLLLTRFQYPTLRTRSIDTQEGRIVETAVEARGGLLGERRTRRSVIFWTTSGARNRGGR